MKQTRPGGHRHVPRAEADAVPPVHPCTKGLFGLECWSSGPARGSRRRGNAQPWGYASPTAPSPAHTGVQPGPARSAPARPGPRSNGGLGGGPGRGAQPPQAAGVWGRGPAVGPSGDGGCRVTSAWRLRKKIPRPRLLLLRRRRPPRSPGSPCRRKSPQTLRQQWERPESGAGRRQR